MFKSAYQQVSSAERVYIDALVAEIAASAHRHGRPVSDALDAPLPRELHERDKNGWLKRPLVLAAIYECLQTQALRDDISLESTAREIHAIAHSNIGDFFKIDEFGDPVFHLDDLPREKLAAVKEIVVEKTEGLTRSGKTKVTVKLHEKLVALKMEMSLMGIEDGDNPFRKSDKATRIPQITDQTTADQAAEEYARMIGDD